MVAGVEQRLVRDQWFPIQIAPGTIIGQGATIELRDGNIWVQQGEPLFRNPLYPVRSVSEALIILIRAVGGPPLDGITVDWSS